MFVIESKHIRRAFVRDNKKVISFTEILHFGTENAETELLEHGA